jgi:hypothetical protein
LKWSAFHPEVTAAPQEREPCQYGLLQQLFRQEARHQRSAS